MAWRGVLAFGFSWAVAGSFGMACGSTAEQPAGDDAGLASGTPRPPGGGAKPGNTIDGSSSSGGQKRPAGSSSSSGEPEEDAGATSSSSSGSTVCDDPNDTEDPNFDLTPFTVGGPTVFQDGVLNGPGDVDEYSFETTGNYPAPNVFFVDPGPGARVCFYATCVEGVAVVTCGDGMTAGADRYGQPGCCGDEGSATSQARRRGLGHVRRRGHHRQRIFLRRREVAGGSMCRLPFADRILALAPAPNPALPGGRHARRP